MKTISLDASQPAQQWLGLHAPEHIGPWARTGGRVTRADGSLRWGIDGGAFAFRIASTDPRMSDGARRCEAVAYAEPDTAMPVGQDFWYAFRFQVAAGLKAADAVCLTQWHQQGGSPLMGLYLQAGRLTLTVRHGAWTASQTAHIWQSAAIKGWQTLVMHARIAQPHGLLRVWHQGSLVAQYAGPLGNVKRTAPYAKCGLYWWPSRNAWDTTQPDRVLLVSLASIIVGAFGPDDVHGMLQ